MRSIDPDMLGIHLAGLMTLGGRWISHRGGAFRRPLATGGESPPVSLCAHCSACRYSILRSGGNCHGLAALHQRPPLTPDPLGHPRRLEAPSDTSLLPPTTRASSQGNTQGKEVNRQRATSDVRPPRVAQEQPSIVLQQENCRPREKNCGSHGPSTGETPPPGGPSEANQAAHPRAHKDAQ